MDEVFNDGLGPHECPLCEEIFDTIIDLVGHAEEKHGLPIYEGKSAWRRKNWEKPLGV